jgi:ABC-type multidrug transport system permease subunit
LLSSSSKTHLALSARRYLWRNFGIMIALIVGFLGSNLYFGETRQFGAGGKVLGA